MRLWSLALAGGLSCLLPASADPSIRRETAVGATVQNVSRFDTVTVTDSSNATFSATIEGGAIVLSMLADPNTARALPAHITLSFRGLSNGAQVIRLLSTRGGLHTDTAAAAGAGFLDHVDYTASLNWGASQTFLSTNGSANASAGASLSGAQTGAVTLDITIPAGGQPLVAGAYSDVLTVQFVGTF